MRIRVFVITLLMLIPVRIWAQQPIRIYVYAHDSGGFVDSGQLANSIKDIQGNLTKRKGTTVVLAPEDADICLEVLTAGLVEVGTKEDSHTSRGIFGGVDTTSTTNVAVLPSITAKIHIPGSEYTKDIGYTGQRLWRVIAGYLGDQLVAWANANRAQLK